MISIQKCREILESDGEKFTDEEILEIRNKLHSLAELALDDYFDKL